MLGIASLRHSSTNAALPGAYHSSSPVLRFSVPSRLHQEVLQGIYAILSVPDLKLALTLLEVVPVLTDLTFVREARRLGNVPRPIIDVIILLGQVDSTASCCLLCLAPIVEVE